MTVRGCAAIAATLSEVLGWLPSDDQVRRWSTREADPLPVVRVLGRLQGEELPLRSWAVRKMRETREVRIDGAPK